jgi:protein required for attachment to host cells
MLLPHGTIVALLDGKSFKLLRNTGTEAHPELAEMATPQLDAHNHSGTSHHSKPGNHADSLVAEDAHAIAATAWLNAEVLAHRIEHLVVIAPPRTLGEMRRHYHKLLDQALLGELAKELTGRQPTEIVAALRSH